MKEKRKIFSVFPKVKYLRTNKPKSNTKEEKLLTEFIVRTSTLMCFYGIKEIHLETKEKTKKTKNNEK